MCVYKCVCVCPPKAPFSIQTEWCRKCGGENIYIVKSTCEIRNET